MIVINEIIDKQGIQVMIMAISDVPYQEVLRAHQSYFCLRESSEGWGFQIDKHETQRGTLQIGQAAPRG